MQREWPLVLISSYATIKFIFLLCLVGGIMALDGVYKLHIVSGADAGETVALSGPSIRLMGGLSTNLDGNEGCLSIRDRSIGGLQAVLTWDKEKNVYRLSNRSAISPIVVNGKACAHAFLVDGTTISVGNSVLQVEAPEGCKAQTNANICEITSNTKEEAVYLGAPPTEQLANNFTPAWLRRGEDAPDLSNLSMEHITSDNYLGHHESLSGGLAGALSADERAHMYAPASRAGRPPGPQPRSAADPDIDSAQKLGIDLALYKQAKAEGFDPVFYAQAYNEGIDPYIYVQACQDGQDPHLYAQAYSVGLDPQTYIETLNQGYDPFAAAQAPTAEAVPAVGENSGEDHFDNHEKNVDYANLESGNEGFGHLFAPPPSINLEKPVAFQESEQVPIFEAQTIVSNGGESLELGEEETSEAGSDEPKYEVVSAPEEHKDGERPRGRLVVVCGADRGLTLDVYGNVTIGRANNNDLILSDLSVSRQHCSVQFLEDGVYLVNHSTSSTTKVGRMPIKRRARLTKENSITLANKVRIHWESYD